MKFLTKSIQIIKANRLIWPGQTASIVLKDSNKFKTIIESFNYDKEIGIPFYFNGKFNVFGCSAQIDSIFENKRKGYIRIKITGKKVFRITAYNKSTELLELADAKISYIDYLNEPVNTPEIISLFEKYCNAVSFVDMKHLSLLDLFVELDLGPEICLSIISEPKKEIREKFMVNILKLKVQLKKQSKSFEFN